VTEGPRGGGAGARIARSLAVYAVLAAAAWWAVPWFRELLLLPALFVRLARWVLVAGGGFVAVIAWRYPEMGASGARSPGEGE
jgi:hypothetical protein